MTSNLQPIFCHIIKDTCFIKNAWLQALLTVPEIRPVEGLGYDEHETLSKASNEELPNLNVEAAAYSTIDELLHHWCAQVSETASGLQTAHTAKSQHSLCHNRDLGLVVWCGDDADEASSGRRAVFVDLDNATGSAFAGTSPQNRNQHATTFSNP